MSRGYVLNWYCGGTGTSLINFIFVKFSFKRKALRKQRFLYLEKRKKPRLRGNFLERKFVKHVLIEADSF